MAKKYELEFFDNLKELNVLPPAFVLRVTDHIEEIINFISVIIEKEHAYATDDGNYLYIISNILLILTE